MKLIFKSFTVGEQALWLAAVALAFGLGWQVGSLRAWIACGGR